MRQRILILIMFAALAGLRGSRISFAQPYLVNGDKLRVITKSAQLFEVTNGINEFDIHYVGGNYHLFYCTSGGAMGDVWHRSAATIAGLSSASDDDLPAGTVPSVYYDSGAGTWHMWLGQGSGNSPDHYTASDPGGTWTLQDSAMPSDAGDPDVLGLIDSTYYAVVTTHGTWVSRILTASDLGGPWTDLGDVFSSQGREDWHAAGEADPDLVYVNSKLYMLFAGRHTDSDTAGGHRHVISVVEINPSTGKAVGSPQFVWSAAENWERDGGYPNTFSPRYLDDGDKRIFYSHFSNFSEGEDGWGYLDVEWV